MNNVNGRSFQVTYFLLFKGIEDIMYNYFGLTYSLIIPPTHNNRAKRNNGHISEERLM